MNPKTGSRILALALLSSTAVSGVAAASARAADHPAVVVSAISPAYPYLMRRAGVTAEVTVLFTVNAKGGVTKCRVTDSTHVEFNVAALDAIKKWTFSPATRNGEPVEKRVRQTFRFTLHDPNLAADTAVASAGTAPR
jgi:protein TonB